MEIESEMFIRHYRIAGEIVEFRQDWDEEIALFSGFETVCMESPSIVVELFQSNRFFREWYGIEYGEIKEAYPHLLLSKQSSKIRMSASKDWSHLLIEGCSFSIEGVMEVFLAGFYSYISLHGGILVHAAMIEYKEEALIFSAASGVGKTTQAELWNKYKEAEILNGDKVILKWGNDRCVAWGSPWKGSSPYAKNKSAPLKAIIVLSQAGKNTIKKLSGQEIMEYFLPHVFFPSWDEACTRSVMDVLYMILEGISVFHLSCLPDEGAVNLTRQTIWGEDEK